MVVMTATPNPLLRAFEHLEAPYRLFDYTDRVHSDKTGNTHYYSDFASVFSQIEGRALIFVPTIRLMQEYARIADNGERRIACLWSARNADHPMSAEQLEVRREILTTERIPAEIDILFINAAYETGLNIRNEDFKTIIIHSGNPDTQVQVRGRLRHDIDHLYIHDKDHEHVSEYFPQEYFNQPLDSETRTNIARKMKLTNEDGRMMKWPSIAKLLQMDSCSVTENRIQNKRIYTVQKIR